MYTDLNIQPERIEKMKQYHCPVEIALNTVGGKYKGIILYHLMGHTLRYHELQKLIPQATPKMLSQQLKELEADGIIIRKLYPVVPPKTEYSLSEFGKSIIPVITALRNWGIECINTLELNEYFDV